MLDLLLTSKRLISGLLIVGGSLIISAALVWRMWSFHSNAPLASKLFWSLTLFVPFFGWLAYAAFFRPPSADANGGTPTEHSQAAWSADT
jgi:type VI protein secretion system component VasK